MEIFFDVIEVEANRPKRKTRAEEDGITSLAPAAVVRNLRAFRNQYKSGKIFNLKVPEGDDDNLFTSEKFDKDIRCTEKVAYNDIFGCDLSPEETKVASLCGYLQVNPGDFMNLIEGKICNIEARLALLKHHKMVKAYRIIVLQQKEEVLAWFANKLKEFNTVEHPTENMCDQLDANYVLKAKQNQAQAAKLWGSVPVLCGCGKEYRKDNKMAHRRTKHHSDWVDSKNASDKRKLDDQDMDKPLAQDFNIVKSNKTAKTEDLVL